MRTGGRHGHSLPHPFNMGIRSRFTDGAREAQAQGTRPSLPEQYATASPTTCCRALALCPPSPLVPPCISQQPLVRTKAKANHARGTESIGDWPQSNPAPWHAQLRAGNGQQAQAMISDFTPLGSVTTEGMQSACQAFQKGHSAKGYLASLEPPALTPFHRISYPRFRVLHRPRPLWAHPWCVLLRLLFCELLSPQEFLTSLVKVVAIGFLLQTSVS